MAPDLFAWVEPEEENLECFVQRQPASLQEVDLLLRVFGSQDLDCIRYGGRDQEILQRLQEPIEYTGLHESESMYGPFRWLIPGFVAVALAFLAAVAVAWFWSAV